MKALVSLLILGPLIFGTLTGCNFVRPKGIQSGPGPKGGPGGNKPDIGPIDFATVHATVIGPKCVRCHNNMTGNDGGANLETYANVKALIQRIQFRSLERRDMPPTGLALAEAQVLAAWIEQGAPEKVDGPIEKPEDIENQVINFALIRDKVFQKHCLSCHSAPNPDDDIDLADLPTVRFKANRIFQRTFVTKDMPIPPSPGLTPAERRVLLRWFDLGMPE